MENADLIIVAVVSAGTAIVLFLAAPMSLRIYSLEGTRHMKKKEVTLEIRAVGKKPQATTTADTGKASHPLKGMRDKTVHLHFIIINCLYFCSLML